MVIASIGASDMRKSTTAVIGVLVCGLLPAAQASGVRLVPPIAAPIAQATVKHASEMRVGLALVPRTDARSQIGDCANVAVIRALMARASGLDSAFQNR